MTQRQQLLFQITPVHNNNIKPLLLLSCATAPCWTVIHCPSCISKCYFLPYAPALTCCIIWMLMNYEAWLLLTFFLLLKLFFIMALAFQSDPALYCSCTVIRQSFCILKRPTYSNVVLVLLQHNSFCHYFDDAVAVKDGFIQAHLFEEIFFGKPLLSCPSSSIPT